MTYQLSTVHRAKEPERWEAWRDFYKDNRLYRHLNDLMAVFSLWPPLSKEDVAAFRADWCSYWLQSEGKTEMAKRDPGHEVIRCYAGPHVAKAHSQTARFS